MILGLVGAICLIVALGMAAGRVGRGSDGASARRILDARVAGGDISPARHEGMLAVRGERTSPGGTQWLAWLLAVAGVTLLVVSAAVPIVGGADARWSNHRTVMAEHMGWNGASTTTATSTDPGAQEITVEAGDLWSQPAAIEIPAGSTVTLTLRNTGEVSHDPGPG